jgi:hypothetical protein
MAVKTCFAENMSSDKSAISTMRGYGLSTVLRTIGQYGFLRFRSGRLSLYRDFSLNPLDVPNELDAPGFMLYDWASQTQNATKMNIAEGALFTIIYPFSY